MFTASNNEKKKIKSNHRRNHKKAKVKSTKVMRFHIFGKGENEAAARWPPRGEGTPGRGEASALFLTSQRACIQKCMFELTLSEKLSELQEQKAKS